MNKYGISIQWNISNKKKQTTESFNMNECQNRYVQYTRWEGGTEQSQKMKTNVQYQKAPQCGAWEGRVGEEQITKGHKETFGDDGYVHYLDGGDGFMNVHRCRNSPNCTL